MPTRTPLRFTLKTQEIDVMDHPFTLQEMPNSTLSDYVQHRIDMLAPLNVMKNTPEMDRAPAIISAIRDTLTQSNPDDLFSLQSAREYILDRLNFYKPELLAEAVKKAEEARVMLFHLLLPGAEEDLLDKITPGMLNALMEAQDEVNSGRVKGDL